MTRDGGKGPVLILLTQSAALSGAELYVLRVARELQVFRPLVVLGESGPLERHLEQAGIDNIVIPIGRASKGNFASKPHQVLTRTLNYALFAWRLLQLIQKTGANSVLYTHSARVHVLGALVARLAGVPVVAHLHDVFRPGVAGRVARAATLALPSRLFANSTFTARSALTRRPVQVHYCPLPWLVDERWESQLLDEPVDDSVILTVVGRITPWKGQHLAINALAELQANTPARAFKLRFVGSAVFEGDGAYELELRALVGALGLGADVEFVGHVGDLRSVYQASTLVLHTSVAPEPFGQVITEAMSCGAVVCAAAAGGPKDVVFHKQNGYLYEMGSSAALVSAVGDALTGLAHSRDLRVSAVRTARYFEARRVVPILERDLLSAINGAAGRGDPVEPRNR